MNEHMNGWLAAYFDGELGELRTQKVRAHLEGCPSCREELKALSSMQRLLGENPEARDLLPAKQFASQVALRLARRPAHPLWRRTVTMIWGSIPAMLLAVWVFAQALFILMMLYGIVLNLGLWPSGLALSYQSSPMNPLLWNLVFSTLIGLMIMSWLASWWVRQQNRMARQKTE